MGKNVKNTICSNTNGVLGHYFSLRHTRLPCPSQSALVVNTNWNCVLQSYMNFDRLESLLVFAISRRQQK